jgi:mannosylglycerate hydrolase
MKTGVVVSHSHWDRAWYLPFEAFRHRLVRMVDRLIALLDADERFRAFTLDGQTVLVEDYLEIRPEREGDLRRLIGAGRLLIGPWYVSPDLFLVSGEALARNLQRGLRMGEAYGSPMPVGYAPDPFGHPAQMPQLLQGFGIPTYVFMRGMDAETLARCGAVFDWVAPDGSAVLALYQREGYFNASALGHPGIFGRFDGRDPSVEEAEARLRETFGVMAPLQPHGTFLLSNGMDHMPEQPELPDFLQALDGRLEGVRLVHGTLPEFLEALAAEPHPREAYTGDLLGNADHPILQSVGSTRIYLKQQNHAAQSLLTGVAEPLAALAQLTASGPDARPFLGYAWRELLRNHPHDDICGCSVDAVHLDDETRFRHVMEVGEAVAVEALEGLRAEGFARPARTGERHSDVLVFNPHPAPTRFRVRTTILFPHPEGEGGTPASEEALAGVDGEGRPVAVSVLGTEPDVMRSAFLEQTWGRRYEVSFEVEVPPVGYTVVHVYGTGEPPAGPLAGGLRQQPSGHPSALENEAYRLTATPSGFALEASEAGVSFPDLLRFEYQSDAGDTYSFSPVPERPPRWARCLEAGPHPTDPALLRAHYALTVPRGLDTDDEVTLDLTVDAGLEPSGGVAFQVRYGNEAENGRLRAVLPVGFATDRALAGALFGLAERTRPETLTPEEVPERYAAYPGELVYATGHHESVLVLEGPDHRVWVADRGLPEHELLETPEGSAVALTLHRAVGYLSVRGGRVRRCGAGPEVPTPGAQCLRDLESDFALGATRAPLAEAVRQARAFAHPAWAREVPYLPHLPAEGETPRAASLLSVDDPAVWLSACTPETEGPGLVVRLVNPIGDARRPTLRFGLPPGRWCETDLRERWDEGEARPVPTEGIVLDLPAYRVLTLVLRPKA